MSKFKLPNKFRNDRTMITSETYIIKRKDAGEFSRVYDYFIQGRIVDTIKVTHEDEKRKEISVSNTGAIMNTFVNVCKNDMEKAYWMQLFLHEIHPSLKDEAKAVMS